MNEAGQSRLSAEDVAVLMYAAQDMAAEHSDAVQTAPVDVPDSTDLVWTQSEKNSEDLRFYAVDTQSGRRRRIGATAIYNAMQDTLVSEIASPAFTPNSTEGEQTLLKFAALEQARATGNNKEIRRLAANQLSEAKRVEVGAKRETIIKKLQQPLGKTALTESVVIPMHSIFDQKQVVAVSRNTSKTLVARIRSESADAREEREVEAEKTVEPAIVNDQATSEGSQRNVSLALSPLEQAPKPTMLRRMFSKVGRLFKKDSAVVGAVDPSAERNIAWNMKTAREVSVEDEIQPLITWAETYWHELPDGTIELHARTGDVVKPVSQVPNFTVESLRTAYKNAYELAEIQLANANRKGDTLRAEELQGYLQSVQEAGICISRLTQDTLNANILQAAAAFKLFKPQQQLPLKQVRQPDGTLRVTFDSNGTPEHQAAVRRASRRDAIAVVAGVSVLTGVLSLVFLSQLRDGDKPDNVGVDTVAEQDFQHSSGNISVAKTAPLRAPKPHPAARKTKPSIEYRDAINRAIADADLVRSQSTWRDINPEAIQLAPNLGTVSRNGLYDYTYMNVQSGTGIGVWHMVEAIIKAHNFDRSMKATASKLEIAQGVKYVTERAEEFSLARDSNGDPIIYAGNVITLPQDFLSQLDTQRAIRKAAQRSQATTDDLSAHGVAA